VVKGLDVFRSYFAGHADQFVLIGGTAATLAMEDAGLAFRATKDLDIVLHIEALTAEFGATFWSFVEKGGYDIREASDTGKPVFYRFQKPADAHLTARKAGGEAVDTRSIRKHANDTMRLSQLLAPDGAVQINENIATDLQRFLDGITSDGSYDPKSVALNISLPGIVERIVRAYDVFGRPREKLPST
jgi:hypothetical protein